MTVYSILVAAASAVAIFLLRRAASLCNARMDVVTNQFDVSIYKHENRQWFDPKVSWVNKKPENVSVWRLLASQYLPGFIFSVANKYKPGYDPFSDFWHYQKFLFLTLDLISAILWASCIKVCSVFDASFISFVVSMILCSGAWAFGWLLTFNAHLKKLLS